MTYMIDQFNIFDLPPPNMDNSEALHNFAPPTTPFCYFKSRNLDTFETMQNSTDYFTVRRQYIAPVF